MAQCETNLMGLNVSGTWTVLWHSIVCSDVRFGLERSVSCDHTTSSMEIWGSLCSTFLWKFLLNSRFPSLFASKERAPYGVRDCD